MTKRTHINWVWFVILLWALLVCAALAVWLLATGLWWIIAVVGLVALAYVTLEGWWKP